MTKLLIPDMSCGHCKATVEKTIKALDTAAVIDFDMTARTIALQTNAASDTIHGALQAAGYPATPV